MIFPLPKTPKPRFSAFVLRLLNKFRNIIIPRWSCKRATKKEKSQTLSTSTTLSRVSRPNDHLGESKLHNKIALKTEKSQDDMKLNSAKIEVDLMNAVKTHWVPNRNAKQCYKWYKDFGLFRRKHHCRIWGNIFCSNWWDKRKVSSSYSVRHQKAKISDRSQSKDDSDEDINANSDNALIRICDK